MLSIMYIYFDRPILIDK